MCSYARARVQARTRVRARVRARATAGLMAEQPLLAVELGLEWGSRLWMALG